MSRDRLQAAELMKRGHMLEEITDIVGKDPTQYRTVGGGGGSDPDHAENNRIRRLEGMS